jgi:hypothetical protein
MRNSYAIQSDTENLKGIDYSGGTDMDAKIILK